MSTFQSVRTRAPSRSPTASSAGDSRPVGHPIGPQFCNHCPYVKHIRPAFASRTREWQFRGVAVVGINSNDADAYPDDSPEAMAREIAEHGYSFPYVIDETQAVASA